MSHHRLKLHWLLFFCLMFGRLIVAKDDPQIGLAPGNLLASFKLPDLNDKVVALEEFRGKIIVIHLWKCQ